MDPEAIVVFFRCLDNFYLDKTVDDLKVRGLEVVNLRGSYSSFSPYISGDNCELICLFLPSFFWGALFFIIQYGTVN